MRLRFGLVLALALASSSGPAASGEEGNNYFVVMGTFASQRAAQDHAVGHGGWVLDTDFYTGLRPSLFASVRGPFQSGSAAEQETAALHRLEIAPQAYVQDAGAPSGGLTALAGELPSVVLAAVLGEIRVELLEREGGRSPCEPQEPYQEIQLWYPSPERRWGGEDLTESKVEGVPTEIDVGGFWYIPRTGAIDQIRVCGE